MPEAVADPDVNGVPDVLIDGSADPFPPEGSTQCVSQQKNKLLQVESPNSDLSRGG